MILAGETRNMFLREMHVYFSLLAFCYFLNRSEMTQKWTFCVDVENDMRWFKQYFLETCALFSHYLMDLDEIKSVYVKSNRSARCMQSLVTIGLLITTLWACKHLRCWICVGYLLYIIEYRGGGGGIEKKLFHIPVVWRINRVD